LDFICIADFILAWVGNSLYNAIEVIAVTENKPIYTKADLLRQLSDLHIPRNRVVMVHSSLRLVGKVEGGAQTILDALIEYFTEEGGMLCIPTHTWTNLENAEIALDMNDPATCTGVLSDLAAADPRGIRTENPSHSVMVFGEREKVLRFVESEAYADSGTGPDTCCGRLHAYGGFVLLIGVSQTSNTFLHTVEEALGVPKRITEEKFPVKIKRKNGQIVERQLRFHDVSFHPDICFRFQKYDIPFRYYGAITDGFFGSAPVQACDAAIMKAVMERIWKNNGEQDPLAGEEPFPPALFCAP
jgi:aminoglycoside 3-N-acetyltransferase